LCVRFFMASVVCGCINPMFYVKPCDGKKIPFDKSLKKLLL
jgi:hypothetical protein